MLESLDVVHFNSSNTLRVYQNRGYSGENACIVSISNGAIQDHKKRRTVKGKLRLGYLGPITTHKGYNLFKGACDEIWNSGIRNFEAHIFVEIGNPPPYMVCHKPYKYQELPDVMNQFDVLVTPSEWEETFGFTVLEGLSYGIPVIVSNRVGAKDLVKDSENGYIVENTVSALADKMKELIQNIEQVNNMNRYIVNEDSIKGMKEHSMEILQLYK